MIYSRGRVKSRSCGCKTPSIHPSKQVYRLRRIHWIATLLPPPPPSSYIRYNWLHNSRKERIWEVVLWQVTENDQFLSVILKHYPNSGAVTDRHDAFEHQVRSLGSVTETVFFFSSSSSGRRPHLRTPDSDRSLFLLVSFSYSAVRLRGRIPEHSWLQMPWEGET